MGSIGNDLPASSLSPYVFGPIPIRILSVEKGGDDRNLCSKNVIRINCSFSAIDPLDFYGDVLQGSWDGPEVRARVPDLPATRPLFFPPSADLAEQAIHRLNFDNPQHAPRSKPLFFDNIAMAGSRIIQNVVLR